MATRKAATTDVIEEPMDDTFDVSGVRSLEPEPEEVETFGVEEMAPSPAAAMTTTSNFYTVPGAINEVIEVEPEIIEGDEPTYRIRLTVDLEPIYIGINYPIPAMRKDVLYEVNQRVYDYLLPKGLIQGK